MEKVSLSTLSQSFSLAGALVLLSLYIVLKCVIKLHKSSLRFLSSLGSCSSRENTKQSTKKDSSESIGEEGLSGEDVEMVLERLRMPCSHDGVQLKEWMAFDELSTLFEEERPSLDEVEGAFSVFDENCDGFIDAVELQRVLGKLGLGGGFRLDACQQMIAVHDENKDGRMDFNEFVKFLDSILC